MLCVRVDHQKVYVAIGGDLHPLNDGPYEFTTSYAYDKILAHQVKMQYLQI